MARKAPPAVSAPAALLLVDLFNDAGNWSGMPLVDGNVTCAPALLGELEQAEYITLHVDGKAEDGSGDDLVWVSFTPAGTAAAQAFTAPPAADKVAAVREYAAAHYGQGELAWHVVAEVLTDAEIAEIVKRRPNCTKAVRAMRRWLRTPAMQARLFATK